MSSLLCNEQSVFSLLGYLPETFLHLPSPQKTHLSAWPSVGTVGTKQLLLSNLSRCIIPGMWEILENNVSWCTGLKQRHHLHVQPYRKALCWGQTPTDPQPSHSLSSSDAFILHWDFCHSYWETQGSRRELKGMCNAKSTFLLPEGFFTSVLLQWWIHSKTIVLLLSCPVSSVSP